MKVILTLIAILALTFLSGCATKYHATRSDGSTTTEITVRSYREFDGGINIIYNRKKGEFELSAGKVTTATSPLEQAAAELIMRSIPVLPLLPNTGN